MSVSLKNIASECKLSVSAVSQILNSKSCCFCSEATKRKVLETAARMGYRRNFGYSLMHGYRTKTVAIMLSMSHMRFEEHIQYLVVQLTSLLMERGYSTYLDIAPNNTEAVLAKVNDCLSRGAEHFIFLGSITGYKEAGQLIEAAGRTCISTSVLQRRYVAIDVDSGVYQVAKYLYDIGKEDFRLVASVPIRDQCSCMNALKQLFPDATTEEIEQKYLRQIPDFDADADDYAAASFKAGYDYAKILLRTEPQVKAVYCNIDSVALGVAAYAHQSGRVIGRDLVIGGLNNDFGVRCSPYPISSVSHGWSRLAKVLAEKAITNDDCQLLFAPEVYIRKLD